MEGQQTREICVSRASWRSPSFPTLMFARCSPALRDESCPRASASDHNCSDAQVLGELGLDAGGEAQVAVRTCDKEQWARGPAATAIAAHQMQCLAWHGPTLSTSPRL